MVQWVPARSFVDPNVRRRLVFRFGRVYSAKLDGRKRFGMPSVLGNQGLYYGRGVRTKGD